MRDSFTDPYIFSNSVATFDASCIINHRFYATDAITSCFYIIQLFKQHLLRQKK